MKGICSASELSRSGNRESGFAARFGFRRVISPMGLVFQSEAAFRGLSKINGDLAGNARAYCECWKEKGK